MTAFAEEMASPHYYARSLAKRFEKLGIDAYTSKHERYLLLLQDSPGEIIDLGRPLKGSRIFGHEAVRKNIPVVSDFKTFAQAEGLQNCMFWCIGLTGSKAAPNELVAAMKTFNSKINVEFSELRKKHGFEMLLIAIHPRFDHESGLFDLHAHFVCRVSPEQQEEVHRRLMVKFSKIDLRKDPIRNAAAVSTYMLWGIWRNKLMLTWPDNALEAAWSLTQHRFRLFRAGGSFAKWRASARTSSGKMAQAADKALVEKNRRDTADERRNIQTEDRLLSKVMVRYGGNKVAALLFETRLQETPHDFDQRREATGEYSSATIVATQESNSAKRPIGNQHRIPVNEGLWKSIRRLTQHATAKVLNFLSKTISIAGINVRQLKPIMTKATPDLCDMSLSNYVGSKPDRENRSYLSVKRLGRLIRERGGAICARIQTSSTHDCPGEKANTTTDIL